MSRQRWSYTRPYTQASAEHDPRSDGQYNNLATHISLYLSVFIPVPVSQDLSNLSCGKTSLAKQSSTLFECCRLIARSLASSQLPHIVCIFLPPWASNTRPVKFEALLLKFLFKVSDLMNDIIGRCFLVLSNKDAGDMAFLLPPISFYWFLTESV
jgi:hypothetical protein